MKINSAVFEKSSFTGSDWVEGGLPEVAFLGRSNVGKSSLLNSLLNRRKLARTSNTPGRTQSINFFLINEAFRFVDLPGYGYARVSQKTRRDWGKMAEEYLAKRGELVLSIQIVDVRHVPSALDMQLFEWLAFHNKPSLVVATKSDKLSNNKLRKSLETIRSLMPECSVLPYSSATRAGREAVWRAVGAAIG